MRPHIAVLAGVIAASLLAGPPARAASAGSAAPVTGRVVEYRIPSRGVPEGIAAGADGALWFSERYTTQLGRLTPRGRFRMFSFPSGNHMTTDVTAGPDGAVWFAYPNSVPSYDSGKIGRITPSGRTTFFTIPWVSDAESITTGPDGNLWFADHVASALGRLTPAGVFTRFPVAGPPGTYPYRLASGADGALWFTDINAHRIGRMTTNGGVTFFPVPGPGYPDAIAPGPDGSLWFTLDDEATVARITTGGVITEFPVAHPHGHYVILGGIVAISGGALAFTFDDLATGESRIGRITTAGAISTVPTPTPRSGPRGITSGPGHGIWFTQVGVPSVAGFLPVGGSGG